MHFLRSRRTLFVLGGVLVAVVALGGTAAFLARPEPTPSPSPLPSPTPSPRPTPSPSPSPSTSPSPTQAAACPYNGLPVADRSVLERPAFLVQVENNPQGRPVSGFNASDMVVEAPVEGDTTRFTAVYLCGPSPAAIGPVRSARYYNVDLWRELHGITTHFGGGGAIITEFARTGTPYVNGITGVWPFFYRAGPRPAPHNAYFDLDGIRAAADDGALGDRVERASRPRSPFRFEDGATLTDGRDVASVVIFTNSYWSFGWTWDAASASWLRSDGGAPSTDALDGERISTTSVVVQFVEQEVLWDELDASGFPRRRQMMVGSGRGIAYAGGRAVDVAWERPDVGAPTTWTYLDGGAPLELPPGHVWWEIVPVGSGVTER
jgi:Protein of unknown function (DUF3048) N-terminal domain/Protein of unknown function (DUF3048) C-terminal domain